MLFFPLQELNFKTCYCLGCTKYSARTANIKSEYTHTVRAHNVKNQTDEYLFNENIFVLHDGNSTFAAKMIFFENSKLEGHRYEIGKYKNLKFVVVSF